ncbi:MAG TPA: efflux RND transporter periplasmic adaptor subunit [Gammaproteobacteria bacterium]|nr:efflux RND transporter periplasmic adaptor subunit [Gammaproteobacteria bacterium]
MQGITDLEREPVRRRPLAALRRGRRWLIPAVIVAVAGGGALAYGHFSTPSALAYKTVTVQTGTIEKTVTSLGSLKPKESVDVGTQVSGQLKQLTVKIGDRVRQGQLLAEIDPAVYETQVNTDKADLANLQAQLAEQQATLALAEQQLARNRSLYKQKAVSKDALDTQATAVKVATARVTSFKAQIVSAQAKLAGDTAKLGYTKIYAPMSGTVVSEPAVVGQTLNANQMAPTILSIANLGTMTVWAQVAEADVPKLKVGMPVYFTTLGQPERRWQATVQQILPTPEIVNDVVLYDVLIDVANPDDALMTSMTAQVFFVLGRAQNVPTVPLAALKHHEGMPADTYRALLLTKDGPRPRMVRAGLENRTEAQIVSGLAVGDRVILGDQTGGRTAARGGHYHMRARI